LEPIQIGLNKEAVDFERIKQASLLILASPKENYAKAELEALKKYVETGGNLFLLLSEGGERRYGKY
jgi:intraflagellar transport protein 52